MTTIAPSRAKAALMTSVAAGDIVHVDGIYLDTRTGRDVTQGMGLLIAERLATTQVHPHLTDRGFDEWADTYGGAR